MPPLDEMTSLLPVARPWNWREKCCKFFYWSCYFVCFLLLLLTVVWWMLAVVVMISLFDLGGVSSFLDLTDGPSVSLSVITIGFNPVDTLMCWIFLGVVARSPRFVGCLTVLKNLIHLPRFWTLVFLLVLYILGAALALGHLLAVASREKDPGLKVVIVTEFVIGVLNVFTKVALVGILNYVQVRNVARSRFKYSVLKGTLVVIWLSQMCTLMAAMATVYHVVVHLSTGNSQRFKQELAFTELVMNLFLLPIVARTAELFWTKILQDNKCIIGKYETSSFTRQNAVETII